MFDVIVGTTDGKTTVSTARWTLAVGCVATAVLTSKLTRDRVKAGRDPVLGLFF